MGSNLNSLMPRPITLILVTLCIATQSMAHVFPKPLPLGSTESFPLLRESDPPGQLPVIREAFQGNASDYVDNVVLLGTEIPQNHPIARSVVNLLSIDETGKATGSCSGMIYDTDAIVTAAHCFGQKTSEVRIRFGVGGKDGWVDEMTSVRFSSRGDISKVYSATPPLWNSKDELIYDLQSYQAFIEAVKSEKEWRVHSTDRYPGVLSDVAVVLLPKPLPPGFEKKSVHRGKISYRQMIYGAGYGLNRRKKSQLTTRLSSLGHQLIGLIQDSKKTYWGVQSYDEQGRGMCFGDSGGPMFVHENGTYFLFGIHTSGYNNCSNSKIAALIYPHITWIETALAVLRKK